MLSERDLGDQIGRYLQLNAVDTGKVVWRSEVLGALDIGTLCTNDDGDIFLLTDRTVLVYRVRPHGLVCCVRDRCVVCLCMCCVCVFARSHSR